jgi:mannose-1-phosphate guanylyltransferase
MTSLKPNDPVTSADRWGIVLSGGNGTRLRDLVYRKRADYLPKQYLSFIGKRSMLEHTLHRAEKLIPAQKLLIVTVKEHLHFDEARRQFASRSRECIVVQPQNKDTAPGILLPLIHLHKRDPDAIVAVFPSDHFVLEEDIFMRHVDHAFRIVESDASRMVLLGLEPHGPDPEYGYIVPGEKIGTFPINSTRQVEMFVEKPPSESAKRIIERGALWNTMVMVFSCKTLLSVIQHAAPDLYHSFSPILDAPGTPAERNVVEEVYQNLKPVNFSKGVIEVLPFEHRGNLVVLPVQGVTWSDWGTPEHLSSTLRDLSARNYSSSQPVASGGSILPLAQERQLATARRIY